jgi:hypothetical protein
MSWWKTCLCSDLKHNKVVLHVGLSSLLAYSLSISVTKATKEDAQEHMDTLYHLYNTLLGYDPVAGATFFKPLSCKAPGERLVTPLKDLLAATSDVVMYFLVLAYQQKNGSIGFLSKDLN